MIASESDNPPTSKRHAGARPGARFASAAGWVSGAAVLLALLCFTVGGAAAFYTPGVSFGDGFARYIGVVIASVALLAVAVIAALAAIVGAVVARRAPDQAVGSDGAPHT